MESLTQILTDNAKYINSPDGNNNVNASPSPCELKCATEQKEVIRCVDSIRSPSSSDSGDDTSNKNTKQQQIQPSCLLEVVSAWTKCCAQANEDVHTPTP